MYNSILVSAVTTVRRPICVFCVVPTDAQSGANNPAWIAVAASLCNQIDCSLLLVDLNLNFVQNF